MGSNLARRRCAASRWFSLRLAANFLRPTRCAGRFLSVPVPRIRRMFGDRLRDASGGLLAGFIAALAELDQSVGDATRVDRIRLLEEVKCAVAAAQVRETAAFAASQRAAQVEGGVPVERAGRG